MRVLLIICTALICSAVIFTAFKKQAKKTSLNHIAVYVTDLSQSVSFYQRIVGLDTMANPFNDGKHAWLPVSEHAQLHLIAGAKTGEEHNKNSHLCFSVASMDDFIVQLKRNNIRFENWLGEPNAFTHRADGVLQIYLKDPDGYWIEINNDKF